MNKRKEKPIVALVDADIIAFRASVINEEKYEGFDGGDLCTVDLEQGKKDIDNQLAKIKNKTNADFLVCMLSGYSFRYLVLDSYKHNRKESKKPSLLGELKEYILNMEGTIQDPNLEADDLLGLTAYDYLRLGTCEPVICTLDKDLQQIPNVRIYNWNKDEFVCHNFYEAYLNFFEQTLTGDSTDGYKGCVGIGKVKARKILDNIEILEDKKLWVDNCWDAVVETFYATLKKKELKGKPKGYEYSKDEVNVWWNLASAEALTQARCAYMLHTKDDFKDEKPSLWHPNSIDFSEYL